MTEDERPILMAVERLEPRCCECGALLPRPDVLPLVGFGFNGEDKSSDRAFIDTATVATSTMPVTCGDCGRENFAYFFRTQP